MTTFTLNRGLDAFEFSFVAMNDSTYADWNASQSMDSSYELAKENQNSLGAKVKGFLSFLR